MEQQQYATTIDEELDTFLEEHRPDYRRRLEDLGGFASFGLGGGKERFLQVFPKAAKMWNGDATHDSLRLALGKTYKEAVYSYIYTLDRNTILGCRAVTKRLLRILYQHATHHPAEDRWTLGVLITVSGQRGIDGRILELAKQIKVVSDNLEHAKWEIGVDGTKVEVENSEDPPVRNVTEDAKNTLIATRDLMILVFGNAEEDGS